MPERSHCSQARANAQVWSIWLGNLSKSVHTPVRRSTLIATDWAVERSSSPLYCGHIWRRLSVSVVLRCRLCPKIVSQFRPKQYLSFSSRPSETENLFHKTINDRQLAHNDSTCDHRNLVSRLISESSWAADDGPHCAEENWPSNFKFRS